MIGRDLLGIEDLDRIVIKSIDGSPIYLSDVGDVEVGGEVFEGRGRRPHGQRDQHPYELPCDRSPTRSPYVAGQHHADEGGDGRGDD